VPEGQTYDERGQVEAGETSIDSAKIFAELQLEASELRALRHAHGDGPSHRPDRG